MLNDAFQIDLDRAEIIDIATRLDGVCVACGMEDCASEDAACPVLHALFVVTSFLRNGRRVLKPTWETTVVPEDAWVMEQELRGVAEDISLACARCQPHQASCVLNMAYGYIEQALGLEDRKPIDLSPGEYAIAKG